MTNIIIGEDAQNMLNDDNGKDKEFSEFNVGSEYKVKVLGTNDYFAFYKYGIYKVVNSFIAKNPSKKSKKGYPVENLTPWDKAWKYHADKSEEFGDKHSQEAQKYKPTLRYAMGFYDLTSGQKIVVDVSRKQAQGLTSVIKKYEKKLDKIAFELSKAEGGVVSLSPVIDMEEDLTDKERQNFEKAPKEFKIEEFTGILREADEDEMIRLLVQAGFDISLIGLELPPGEDTVDTDSDEDEELPF